MIERVKANNAVVLINLGTPDSPQVNDVRRYLQEFLMDGRVMDIPWLNRFLLVYGIIAPFRSPQSAKLYEKLWTKAGSPLKVHAQNVCRLLSESLGNDYWVTYAMRYQKPSIREALDQLRDQNFQSITVIPLYPQYAESSTGSTVEEVFKVLKRWRNIPALRTVAHFPNDRLFIDAFAAIGRKYMARKEYDYFLFSYHGLPERQIRKASVNNYCQLSDKCCQSYHALNRYCYRAQCYETTRHIANALGLRDNYSVSFQSRLGRTPWIKPYSDLVIDELAKKGHKNVLVFSPSFVADCLETTVEIGMEYRHMFLKAGGQSLDLVESLNSHPSWIECLKTMVLETEENTAGLVQIP